MVDFGRYEVEYIETGEQPYADTVLSAGLVEGHAVDTIYLRFWRPMELSTTILLRRDEALAICQLLAGALWSDEISSMKGGDLDGSMDSVVTEVCVG
jgi:hypothetical protein